MQTGIDIAIAFWGILVEAGPWLLLGFLVAGCVQALLPMDLVQRVLGRPGKRSVVVGSIIGAPLPLCSCSVIPVVSSLRRAGASKGASAAFAVATPETGVDSVALTYGMMGPVVAIARLLGAVGTAMATGFAIDAIDRPSGEASATSNASDMSLSVAPSSCCAQTATQEPVASCCSSRDAVPRGSFIGKCVEILRYAVLTLPADLASWMLVGLLVSAAIGVLVPTEWIGEHVPAGLPAMLLMLVVSLPLYVCAASSTPVAAMLIAKGLSPGAALVLLFAGPATNTATIAWAWKDLGKRATLVYLVCISVCSVGAGLAFDAFVPAQWVLSIAGSAHEHATHQGVWNQFAGGALALLLFVGVFRQASLARKKCAK